ncbi:MAG: c-type cytochrome [Kiloniellaceae bacterium]
MSTLEINKIVAAVLTAGVVALASGFVTEIVFEHEATGELAYRVSPGVAVAEAATPKAAPESIAPLLAAADPDVGAKVSRKCAACHTLNKGGANKIGPNLWNVVNRPIAAADGYSYSTALKGKAGETWSYDNLNAFLTKPKDWAPGTKMGFAGLKKIGTRAELIAYLRTLSDAPAPLPE